MAIDIFSAKPSSFNLDKNSTFATNLKATITDKLTHYLADYSDDVLAKYIVVLICNGKDQHETRHELEAFLGKESKEFVSWLWNFLLDSVDRFRSKRVLHSEDEFGYSGDVDVKKKSRRRRGVRSHAKEDANMLSEDEKVYYPSKSVSSKHKSKGSRCYSRKSKSSLSEINDMYGRRKLLKHAFSKICGPTESDCTGVTKYAPSELDVSSEESSGSERSMLYVKENKVVPNHSAELPSQPLCLPNDEEHSINLKSIAARGNHIYAPSSEDVAGGTSSTWSIDSVTHPNETLRGSVWDRLGRQCNDDRIVRGGRLTGEVPFCDDGIDADTDRRLEHDSKRICIPHHADEINRKRQFTVISVEECKYRHLRYTEPPLNQLQRTSSNSTRSEGLNSMSSGTRQREPLLPNQAFGVSESVFIQDARDGSPITNPNPLHSQLLDMKSRLHQIEKKMSTLRAKKLESNEYTSELISSAGVLNHSADNEPGTISITNGSQQQRPSNFMTKYKDARFFVIKSYSGDNVHESITHGIWSSTVSGNKKLNNAYLEAKENQCPVFLFFSVNGSGKFCGVAEMVGPVDFEKSFEHWETDKWTGLFAVKWHIVKEVPSGQFRHIILENNNNEPVTRSKDTQEVELDQGLEMLTIFKNYENIPIVSFYR